MKELSYKTIDFSEPMPEMIERLKREHVKMLPELAKIESNSDLKIALSQIESMKHAILKHAIEEEARVMRVIMAREKSESAESVRIMQEHRWVSEFLERRLVHLQNEESEKAWGELRKFIRDLREHFDEEEKVVFPLALRALADGAS